MDETQSDPTFMDVMALLRALDLDWPDNPGAYVDVSYDRFGDVLYIKTRAEDGTEARVDENGIVRRYDDQGVLVGATVMDFRERSKWQAACENRSAYG